MSEIIPAGSVAVVYDKADPKMLLRIIDGEEGPGLVSLETLRQISAAIEAELDRRIAALEAKPAPQPGKDGASAYQLAVAAGFSGTMAQWLASLKGAPGGTATVAAGSAKALAAGAAPTVTNSGTASNAVFDFGIPAGAKGDDAFQVAVAAGFGGTRAQWLASLQGAPGATTLGTITVAETIAVAIGSGVRRVTLTTPAAWGVVAGQNLIAFPASVPASTYAVHDVIATAANTISVAVSTPALAVLASYSISCRLVRIG